MLWNEGKGREGGRKRGRKRGRKGEGEEMCRMRS